LRGRESRQADCVPRQVAARQQEQQQKHEKLLKK
jgi:hypothetical protein